jgi:hypothetical protein
LLHADEDLICRSPRGGRAGFCGALLPPRPGGLLACVEDDRRRAGGRRSETPKPNGLFEPEGDSIAAMVEKPEEGADAVAVMVESEGGPIKPTSEPMLVDEVKA